MLIVTQREMKRAFRAHLKVFRDAPNPPSCSHHLALVYAVECGLKAQVMVERGAADTNGLPETLTRSGGGHDLRAGLKELRAPAALVLRD